MEKPMTICHGFLFGYRKDIEAILNLRMAS
jgi:hypothetical protein